MGMARRTYIPQRGDIAWINLDPVRGHEQSGNRPVLVVSSKYFNRTTGLAIIVPITSKRKGYPIEVPILGKIVNGVALASAMRSIDWRTRRISFVESCPDATVRAIQGMLIAFIEGDDR